MGEENFEHVLRRRQIIFSSRLTLAGVAARRAGSAALTGDLFFGPREVALRRKPAGLGRRSCVTPRTSSARRTSMSCVRAAAVGLCVVVCRH